MDLEKEIAEIGRLIGDAGLIMAVRREVAKARKDGFVVTDGRHHEGASDYDVVVRCSGEDDMARRIRSEVPDIEVEKIADGVIGVRGARRMRDADL